MRVHGSRTGTSEGAKRLGAKPPRNVHSLREFTIKVQPPMVVGEAYSSGPCGFMSQEDAALGGIVWAALVYDEHRSFTSYLPLDMPGIGALLRLVRQEGRGGIRGYFAARREGEHLRVFTDRMVVPQPSW